MKNYSLKMLFKVKEGSNRQLSRLPFQSGILLLFVSLVLLLLFVQLRKNIKNRFEDVSETAIVLSENVRSNDLADEILLHDYVSDTADANFIANHIVQKLMEGTNLSSVYSLSSQSWRIPSVVIDSAGGSYFSNRLEHSYGVLGMNDSITMLRLKEDLPSVCRLSQTDKGSISVNVKGRGQTSGSTNVLTRSMDKIFPTRKRPCPGVLVKLVLHYYDSTFSAQQTVLAFAKTDSRGNARFDGLDTNRSYSVLPVRKGFEYGNSKGTEGGTLGSKGGSSSYSFIQKEHTLPLFDPATIAQIKKDHSIVVRSLDDYLSSLIVYVVLFFVFWWSSFFFVKIIRKKNFDEVLMAVMMALTGLCFLTMLSIQDPLVDGLNGFKMARGIFFGVIIVTLLQCVDFVKFYQDGYLLPFDFIRIVLHWFCLPFKRKVAKLNKVLGDSDNVVRKFLALLVIVLLLPLLLIDFVHWLFTPVRKVEDKLLRIFRGGQSVTLKIVSLLLLIICLPLLLVDLIGLPRRITEENVFPKGYGYLLLAIVLTLLLWVPGLGMSVGGMRVNLNLLGIVFQPSEIAKYLMIVFMAAFFTLNADSIICYSADGQYGLIGNKFRMLTDVLVGLFCLLGLYLVLGDMGPGLVLGVTFIFLYSIVKSKVKMKNTFVKVGYNRLLSCDLSILIIGVVSFILFLFIGKYLHNMAVFALLWLLIWIFGGLLCKRQFFETPIMLNFVIAVFIFVGPLLSHLPIDSLKDTGARFEIRNEMCSNTWGTLGLNEGEIPNAGSNTQVAEGLWGLASGGVFGQGLGQGNSNLIPAFHTDMVLESIGEQMGWLGLFCIVVLMVVLLKRTIEVGYRSGHSFTLYLCFGIAIVTAVQFLIISLGSTGIIPLTGITVPFLSFGSVSMILNMLAFGVVLSLSQTDEKQEETSMSQILQKNISEYKYPIAIMGLSFSLISVFVLSVFLHYQFFHRNHTLIRPLYVETAGGEPVIEYNPRIALLTREMKAGNIYARDSLLLATSNPQNIALSDYVECGVPAAEVENLKRKHLDRFYPFSDRLFFMVGDANSKLYFNYNENFPVGYMAEAQHLSYLRGYDNVLYDKAGNPVSVNLCSDNYREDRFLGGRKLTKSNVVLRDYSALLPFLKVGIESNKVKRFNKGRKVAGLKPQDLYLTLDAKLQVQMQNALEEYVNQKDEFRTNNKLRISVVVLDAENGDLLASANYPLASQDVLSAHSGENFRDVNRPTSWKTYTDRDLGMTFPTPPGSTAKVMSALAGLRKMGVSATRKRYNVFREEIVEITNDGEPYNGRRSMFTNGVSMRDAIVYSSNCYFINLVNDNDLYDDLAFIYQNVGARIEGVIPYYMRYAAMSDSLYSYWLSIVNTNRQDAVSYYQHYIQKREQNQGPKRKMSHESWQWAWGQGTLDATPLAMARVASVVANNGRMPKTRFVSTDPIESVQIVEPMPNAYLKAYMKAQTESRSIYRPNFINSHMGGKTGTPERVFTTDGSRCITKCNDGWYVFFVERDGDKKPIAVAVRLERLSSGISDKAMNVSNDVVIKVLKDRGYMN